MKRRNSLSFTSTCSLIFCSVVSVSLSGCLLSHSNHKIVRQNEPLKQLSFETENARSVFETQVDSRLNTKSRASFGIPFIVGLEKSVTTAENAVRNDLATKFDINGDQIVSDYEANLQNR